MSTLFVVFCAEKIDRKRFKPVSASTILPKIYALLPQMLKRENSFQMIRSIVFFVFLPIVVAEQKQRNTTKNIFRIRFTKKTFDRDVSIVTKIVDEIFQCVTNISTNRFINRFNCVMIDNLFKMKFRIRNKSNEIILSIEIKRLHWIRIHFLFCSRRKSDVFFSENRRKSKNFLCSRLVSFSLFLLLMLTFDSFSFSYHDNDGK